MSTWNSKTAILNPLSPGPEGVPPPSILDRGATYLYVGWAVPDYPNGNLTGYFLMMNDQELYNGVMMSYNVTDLSVSTRSNQKENCRHILKVFLLMLVSFIYMYKYIVRYVVYEQLLL